MSVDPVESEPPYQYVRGNVVNRTDPSGLCEQVGDEACWSVYEAILRLCPLCADMERLSVPTGTPVKLHEDNINYLKRINDRVQNGWWPCDSVDIPDTGAIPGNRNGSPYFCYAAQFVFRNKAIIHSKSRLYGVPPALIGGLIAAEIDLDNTSIGGMHLDDMVRRAYRTLESGATGPRAWAAKRLIELFTNTDDPTFSDRVAGYSNVHHGTYILVEDYMTECGAPLPYGTNKSNYTESGQRVKRNRRV